MKMKLIVTGNCISCGLCVGCKYLKELSDGTVEVKGGGIINEKDMDYVKELIEVCPENIFALQPVESQSKAQIEKEIEKKIEGFKLQIPDKKKFGYDVRNVSIDGLPYGAGKDNRFIFSSERKAKSAARADIDSAFFSKRDSVVKNVINDYRSEKLSPYFSYEEIDSNFYYQANIVAQKVLDEIVAHIQVCDANVSIPNSLREINVRPDTKSIYMDGIGVYLLNASRSIVRELDEGDSSLYGLDSYVDYLDIEEMTTYEENRRGKYKEVTKYAYAYSERAREEIIRDLKSALGWSFDEKVVDSAYETIKSIVKEYEMKLRRDLEEKAKQLKQLIN